MTSTNGISPTLDYLSDAAHLMRMAARETSAHLMSQRSNLMFHHDMAMSDVQRQHVCGACGHIMIPGSESTLKLEARRRKQRTKQPPGQRPTTKPARDSLTKGIQCGRCDRQTRISIALPPPVISRHKVSKAKSNNLTEDSSSSIKQAEATAAAAPKTSANASSKKRAKNRKAGLQALLAGQQQQRANPLSLADFMRK
jgi:RNase P subunit RPR2